VSRGGRIVQGDPNSLNPDQAWCRGELARLAEIDFERRFRDLVGSAERANVSFYPIDVRGLTGDGRSVATLQTLANATDGYAGVNSNDINAPFRRIAERLSAYYLLGYYSNSTVNDGKYRSITVRVKQPGVSVEARRGYFAPPPDAVVAKLRAEAAARAGPAIPATLTSELERLGKLTGGLEVYAYGAVRAGTVDVVAELATRELERGRWANGAGVEVTVTDAAGKSSTGTGRIDRAGRALLVSVPTDAGQSGPWRVRVRVTGDQGPADDRVEVAMPTGTLLGAAVTFRGTASARSALQPVAEFLFRRTERLHVEWPVLKPLASRTGRLLDRRGQPIGSGLTLTEHEAGPGRPMVAVDFAVGGLPEGDYAIEVSAAAGAETDVKLVAFRVGR
jgi:hypothetical protein